MTISVRPDLALMSGYHSPQLDVAVRLNANESAIAPPDAWRQAFLAELAVLPFHRYPDREVTELRAALGKHHGVGSDEIFCGKGSNEVLQCLLIAYGGPGRRAAVFEPTYALHSHISRLTSTGVVVGDRAPDFHLDLGATLRLVRSEQPEVTFVCSPNNPTGGSEPVELIAEILRASTGLVVVDEAYALFARRDALGLRDGPDGDRLVVVRTFSKTWALAGARLGYVIAAPPVVAALQAAALPYHLDAATQVAGRLALRFADETQARVAEVVDERARLAAALQGLPVRWWPSDANFILFQPRERSGGELWQELVDRSILVRNCSEWPGLENCLRVTVGTREEDDAFLAALAECLS